MKKIYELIANRLKEIEEIRFIDMDNGQLDYYEYRAAVDFPACLISIDYPSCDNIGLTGAQQCHVNIGIRLVAQVFDDTNIAAPEDVRNRALAIYDIMDKIQESLQWWKPDEFLSKLTRKNATREKREDGLMVLNINYITDIVDTLHYEPNYTTVQTNVMIEK